MTSFADFTLLLPVYIRDKYEDFIDCITSIRANDVQPAQILIVFDGPVVPEISEFSDRLCKHEAHFSVLKLPVNRGLANALNVAVDNSRFDVICRMDADDVCEADRFRLQWNEFNEANYDLLGSSISEFDCNSKRPSNVILYPQYSSDVKRQIKYRNPFAHPTMMFRKDLYIKAGQYHPTDRYFEDWGLWLRILPFAKKIGNIQKPLVRMRANVSQRNRRRGYNYIICEWKFFIKYQKLGLLNFNSLVYLTFIRTPVRLLPFQLFEYIYNKWR